MQIVRHQKKIGLMTDLNEQTVKQKRFSTLQGESVLIDGLASYLKSSINVISGHAYLTNYRLIFCRKMLLTGMALFGGAGFGYSLGRKQTSISFQIALPDIRSIKKGKYGFSSKYTVETNIGQTYNLQFTDEAKWVELLISQNVDFFE